MAHIRNIEMKKHFVTFYSPGTLVVESTTKEIDSWNVSKAIEMSKDIKERYNAVPYGFKFTTRSRGPNDLDSKVTSESCMYFINCEVVTLEALIRENNPEDSILISNMRNNGYDRVARTISGWKWAQPFEEDDVCLQ